MNTKNNRLRLQAAAAALAAALAHAQVATDGSVGTRVNLAGPNYAIAQSLGLQRGGNLLHSFETFNISRGESATFFGVGGIVRIIARVTGGTVTGIDGVLRSTIPGAALYLVNPAGIVFGENASLDVGGSFYASTANYLRLADGTRIPTTATSEVLLTAAPIEAFGFSGPGNGIVLSGAQLRGRDGFQLGLVGGAVSLANSSGRASSLTALGGSVAIVGTASAGEALLAGDAIRPEGFARMGDVGLGTGTVVSVNESSARTGAGTIYIRGEDVALDHAQVLANTRFGNGRGIDIAGTGRVDIAHSLVQAATLGAADAGNLRLEGHDIVISGSSLLETSCNIPTCTTGSSGRIDLIAPGSLVIAGTDPLNPTILNANSDAAGRAGDIHVTAGALMLSGSAAIQSVARANGDSGTIRLDTGSIVLTGGAQVDAAARGDGQGGRIEVVNAGAILIDGVRPDPNPPPGAPTFFPSAFLTGTVGNDRGGEIVISTRTLDVVRGGQVSSAAGFFGSRPATGNAGSIRIAASERVTIQGFATSSGVDPSGMFSTSFGSGSAGAIEVSAPSIRLSNSGRIASQGEGVGNAGPVTLRGGDLTLESNGQVSSDARRGGAGGTVTIELAGDLSITGSGSGVFSSTASTGSGGRVDVLATNIRIADFGVIASDTRSGQPGAGNGGAIRVQARESISLSGGAAITAQSTSTGAGGTVEVRSDGTLTLESGSSITTRSTQSGNSGSITVYAHDSIFASGDSRISTQSDRTGLAGPINLSTDGLLQLSGGARITTQAVSSDGGDIQIRAPSALLDQSQITTEVGTGQGGGGNMDLRIETLVMRSSTITANAFGGPGGNIFIATKTFIPSADSKVTASSQLGIDGTITIESPALDPTGELLMPGVAYFDAASVLAGRCGPRLAGRASSLVVEPRRLADVSPDALRSMLELLAPSVDAPCCPAPASRS